MAKKIVTHNDLDVYRKAMQAAMEIFELSKTFPKEETYSLTDQIRRSSRSVCTNIAEGGESAQSRGGKREGQRHGLKWLTI